MTPSREPAGRLQRMIAQGEHKQQDFKYKIDDAPKLARSVSAFANTDGGRLLIGVRDDGTIHGVRSEEEIFMMHAAAYKYCTPVPVIQFETLQVPTAPHGGHLRTVVICTVLPSALRPIFALEAPSRTAYIRINDENIVASPVHLAIWRQEARVRGEAYGDSPEEHALLLALNQHPEGLTLNALLRELKASASAAPRHLAIDILARFIRFGLARIEHYEQQWLFLPAE